MTFASVKSLVAFILLLSFSAQTFYSASVTMWFFANRTSIAIEKCINKAKPEMQCKGKCYLSKKLKETEEKKDDNTSVQLKQWVETAPFLVSKISLLSHFNTETPLPLAQVSDAYTFDFSRKIFHPPTRIIA